VSDTVAVIGLGTMGGRVAARLAEQGAHVRGFDPSPAAAQAAGAAVEVHGSAASAARGAGTVVLSLPRPADVLAVAADALTGLDADTVVVDLSTIDPASARAAAETVAGGAGEAGGRGRGGGASYLDAPVLGRPDRCGHWTLAVGGEAQAVERVRPLLERSVAKTVAHIGEVGSGSVVKLLNNLMFGGINAVTAEVFNICRLTGVEPEQFARVVSDSGAATVSGLFRELGAKIPAGDFSPAFGLGLLQKDNRLALRLAESSGSPAFVAHCVDQVNTLAAARDWAAEDTSAVYRLYELLSADHDR
jgi:3-hydroxyisobutyrate dehydrogenase